MKKLLKFILMPMLAGAPVMTVVACGADNSQTDDNDVLNSAFNRMESTGFSMNEQLGIGILPAVGASYNSLTTSVRNIINQHFSDLVTNGLNWDYPSVQVTITAKSGSMFIQKYGADIEAKIDVIVHLKFKDLTERTKTITIKINNDLTNGQQKVDALKTYLVTYLNTTDPIINFRTALPDEIKNNDSFVSSWTQKINAYLRTALFDTNKDNPDSPIIDLGRDLTMQVTPDITSPNLPIYSLDGQAINATTKNITGVVENLVITLNYKNEGLTEIKTADLTNQKIKIAQNFVDVQNQIATSLKQGPEALVFGTQGDTMPVANEVYSVYDSGGSFTTKVQDKIFAYIEKTYPTAKMGPVTGTWDKTAIIIPTQSQSTLFVMDDNTASKQIGHFSVDLEFKVKIDVTTSIDMKVTDVQLNLNQNIAP